MPERNWFWFSLQVKEQYPKFTIAPSYFRQPPQVYTLEKGLHPQINKTISAG
jgi:hypothetical protein